VALLDWKEFRASLMITSTNEEFWLRLYKTLYLSSFALNIHNNILYIAYYLTFDCELRHLMARSVPISP
jgi:hypothetical protein